MFTSDNVTSSNIVVRLLLYHKQNKVKRGGKLEKYLFDKHFSKTCIKQCEKLLQVLVTCEFSYTTEHCKACFNAVKIIVLIMITLYNAVNEITLLKQQNVA